MSQPDQTDPSDHLSLYLQGELQEMRSDWAELIKAAPGCPHWTWDQVLEALLNHTVSPVEELVVRGSLSALVKEARFKPPRIVLEDLVRLVRASHDAVFQRHTRQMLEAEMSSA